MAYQYYQSAYPGWGQNELQFGAPPIPNIRPQPSWNGWDYYNAHGLNSDPSLFFSLISRVREYGATGGVGLHEARVWHRRIYSGLVDLTRALPTDIGSAAAYEAYRMWRHHHNTLYSYVSNDREREREGLIGLAAAEASHLWQFSGRPMDTYGLREVLESAALTASRISYRVMDEGREQHLSRRTSDDFEEDYPHDHHRHRRHSSIGSARPVIVGKPASTGSYGTPYSNPIPIPGQGSPYSGTAGSNGGYYGNGSLPRSYGNSLTVPGYQPGIIPGHSNSYGGFPGTTGTTGYTAQPQYTAGAYPQAQSYTLQSSAFPGGAVSIPPVPPGSTIIIQQQPRKPRHNSTSSHKHHHHHRSRSSEPVRTARY